MKYVNLGGTGLRVSRVCLGMMSFGNDSDRPWVLDEDNAEPIVKALGNDALRYYLLREVVFGQDGNFSKDALITRYNADLANGLGNHSSRTLTMIENYCGGVVPAPTAAPSNLHEIASTTFHTKIRNSYDKFEFSDALTLLWGSVAIADKYLAAEKPWALAKDPAMRPSMAQRLS